jgi:hypothetical protein
MTDVPTFDDYVQDAARFDDSYLSEKSRQAYKKKVDLYTDFCVNHDRLTDEGKPMFDAVTLTAFTAYAMGKGEFYLNWSEGTMRSALTALVAHCERTQYYNPISDKLVQRRVEHVIKGASRQEHQLAKQRETRAQRLPLMPAHIQLLLRDYSHMIPDSESLVFRAVILTASVTLVRMGNLLATRNQVDATADLTLQHVSLDRTKQEMFALTLPRTKTSVAGRTVYVINAGNQAESSAFNALQKYHIWRLSHGPREPASAYFVTTAGRTYTKSMALSTLRLLLAANGDDPFLYGLHSTRHGGATALTEAGVPEAAILAAGGWKAPKMLQIYARRTSREQIAAMQQQMEQSVGTFRSQEGDQPAKRPKKRRSPLL